MDSLTNFSSKKLQKMLSQHSGSQDSFENSMQALGFVDDTDLFIENFDGHLLIHSSVPNPFPSEEIRIILNNFGLKSASYCQRGDSQNEISSRIDETTPIETFLAKENSLNFWIDLKSHYDPGIFLDQKINRQRVKSFSKGKKVLNLFSYTCAFSVFAASGEARLCTSVDLSQKYLDWGKRNFKANAINPDQHEFYAWDTREFLQYSIKKNRKFDLIICDPPTFSKSKRGYFKVKKDLIPLLKLCLDCLNPSGKILACTNHREWNKKSFHKEIDIFCSKNKLTEKYFPYLPDGFSKNHPLKSAWIFAD